MSTFSIPPAPGPPAELLTLIVRAANTTTSNGTSTSLTGDTQTRPAFYKAVGISLAVASGLFIGTSFVLKKLGLLAANKKYNEAAGEGYGYLKNAWWWSGMTLMIIGEICNFVAYSFVDAILVTPLGALTVVVTTILSAIFLKERLSFVGKVGCFNCIVGSIIIVMNAPDQSSVKDIQGMQYYVISAGFLAYAGVIIAGCLFVALWVGPRYGKKSMLVYLSICSLIGGLSVVATQGLGAAIVAQIGGEEQFKHWFLYVLFVFVICTLLTEIIYLNKALNIFNAALVTPTYYVYFTSATLITSCVLFRGLHGATVSQIITIILGFFQICSGVVLLQLSKSAKDVPDAAVFKGDLDQVRTVAEVEEPESEPHADTVRGVAGLVRTLSKTRQKREMEEVKRIREESLAPISEDEQVEWDGLRRRKTVLSSHHSNSVRRQKTVHYPLGMSYFPPGYDQTPNHEDEHDPENDLGFIPRFGRRAQTALSSLASRPSLSRSPEPMTPRHATTLPLTEMRHANPHELLPPKFADSRAVNISPSPERPSTPSRQGRGQTYGLLDQYHRNDSLIVPDQDTSYKSPNSNHLTWAPTPSQLPPLSPYGAPPTSYFPHATPQSGSPAPPPPAHGVSNDRGRDPSPMGPARRQFSFQTIFGRRENSFERSREPSRSRSRSPNRNAGGHRVIPSFSKRARPKTITEEERLGLVQVGSDIVAQEREQAQGAEIAGTVRRRPQAEDQASDTGSAVVLSEQDVRTGRAGADPYTDEEDDADEDEFGLARQQAGGSGYARISNVPGRDAPASGARGQRRSAGRYGRDDLDDDDLGGRAFV